MSTLKGAESIWHPLLLYKKIILVKKKILSNLIWFLYSFILLFVSDIDIALVFPFPCVI